MVTSRHDARTELFTRLESAVAEGVFPGCVALVWRGGEIRYHEAHGVLATHRGLLATDVMVARDTVYDLASLTKVLCTTSLVAIALGRGRMALDDTVPAPFDRGCPGARLVDLLEHCSGLEAHREYFVDVRPGDRETLLRLVADTPSAYPLRETAVYSDLGFIILGAWLERVFDASLDEAFDREVAGPLGVGGQWVDALRFRPIEDSLIDEQTARRIAPTEVYDPSLHPEGTPSWFSVRATDTRRCAHGEVHDDNAFVMGGVAGHAGLFGTAQAVLELSRGWLEGRLAALDSALRGRIWRKSAVAASTRRLGWDGQSIDGSGSTGGALSGGAVGHTGYTGTSLWVDPAGEGSIYVLLSNRVHPTRLDDRIKQVRRDFHRIAHRL